MLKILILVAVILVISAKYDVRDDVFFDRLVGLSEVRNTENSYIHIAMIVTIGKSRNTSQLLSKIRRNLREAFKKKK